MQGHALPPPKCECVMQAAEARAKRAGLMLSGPRKLGGSVTGLTPREACSTCF